MTVMSEELLEALEADETGDLDAIIEQRPRRFRRPTKPHAGPDRRGVAPGKGHLRLGARGDPAVVEAIQGLLPHLDQAERIAAIDALGRLGTEDASDSILQYVDDESMPVRKFVTRALGRINTPRARAELSKLERTDPSDYIRSLASKQLSRE
jgi:HEAT repeat protein